MNDRFANQILDDARFDRLVDGELPAEEYQALLASLDDEPSGWRRCAMAFLEAQAWRSEMAAIRRGQEATPASKPSSAAGTVAWRRWLPLLAIAASFVMAFFGGLALQRELDRRQRDDNIVAGPAGTTGEGQAHQALRPGDDLLASGQEPRSLGNIRLVMDGGQADRTQNIDVPVYDLNQVGAEWLMQDRPALSEGVIESLRRRGRKVERQIEYLPLPLDDEHQIVLPVEQIQITPVSRGSY